MTGWRPTVAHYRATVTAVVLLTVAVIWRRPDLLVLVTPLAIVAAWSAVARSAAPPSLDERLAHPTIREGAATTWIGNVADAGGADLAWATAPATPWFEYLPRAGTVVTPVADDSAELRIAVRSTRWGRRELEPFQIRVASAWGAFQWSTSTEAHRLISLPLPPTFDSAAPARPRDGLVGLHRSAHAGEGGEFAGLRPFQVGDRIRRINWPRSLRMGELHVNATWADQDLHVALVIDASDDVGVSGGVDGPASSLDIAVRAAGSIAEHFARRGDRVSLRVFGAATARNVPPAAGHAQLRRLLDSLTLVSSGDGRRGGRRGSSQQIPITGDALTVMLSPLVSPEALDRAVALGRHGLTVVVIDTLPEHVVVDDDEHTALAWRIRLLERRRELRAVQGVGVSVVRWVGAGSLDQFLRDIARHAAAPRMDRR